VGEPLVLGETHDEREDDGRVLLSLERCGRRLVSSLEVDARDAVGQRVDRSSATVGEHDHRQVDVGIPLIAVRKPMLSPS
jgi:hypothetical protein